MSNEKHLLGTELASICNKTLPNTVSINSFVYIYMWPDPAAIFFMMVSSDNSCIRFGPGACICNYNTNQIFKSLYLGKKEPTLLSVSCSRIAVCCWSLAFTALSLGIPSYAHYQTFLRNWEIPTAGCCFHAFPQDELQGCFCQVGWGLVVQHPWVSWGRWIQKSLG